MLIAALAAFATLLLSRPFIPLESAAATPGLVAVVSCVTLLPLIGMVVQRRFDFFELICPVSVSYFLYFAIAPRNPIPEVGTAFPWITDREINLGLLYVGMGFSFLMAGYYSPLPAKIARVLPRFAPISSEAGVHAVIYTLYAVGALVRLYLLAHGTGTWSTIPQEFESGSPLPAAVENIGYFNNLALFAYLFATAYYFSPGRTRLLSVVLWGVMFPLECGWVFLQGSKGLSIPVLLSPLIAYNYLRKKVGYKQILVPALFFVFVVFPVISEYRSFAGRYPIQLDTLTQNLPKIGEELVEGIATPESDTFVGKAPELVTERTSGLLPLASTIHYVAQNGQLHGETLQQMYLVILPGFLVTDKYQQLAESGDIYREDVSGYYDTRSGITIMQVGEFYLNFGLWGVLIGMFLQGVLFRVWQLYWISAGGALNIALYTLGWRMLTVIEFPIAVGYGLIVRELMMMIPLGWIMVRGHSIAEQPGRTPG